jgi:hypothetical protein
MSTCGKWLREKYSLSGKSSEEIKAISLSAVDCVRLDELRQQDMARFCLRAATSLPLLADCISRRQFRWASVISYYSTFYSMCVFNIFQKHIVFYAPRKKKRGATMFSLNCEAGSSPVIPKSKTSHEKAFADFKLLSQESLLTDSVSDREMSAWHYLKQWREHANYRATKPDDPTPFDGAVVASQKNIRLLINEYIHDRDYIYSVDPEHILLAYPISVYRFVIESLGHTASTIFSRDAKEYVRSLCRDGSGKPFPVLASFICSA